MKILFAGFTGTAMAVTLLGGCTQGTPGGPGTTDTSVKKPAFGQADDTFNLSVPVMASSLQQGEKMEATIGIKRAKNFDEDVALAFADVPQGVTVEPADSVIKHGDSDAKITFTAADEAATGVFKIKVTGHPTKGSDAKIEFKLTIAAKDTFTLSVPHLSTSLKQGETKTVAIGIKRDKTFDQDVALEFGKLPMGVTLEPSAPVIKNSETEVQIVLTVAEDASLGNFTIKLTGHPATGADATSEFKFAVVKQ